LTEDELRLRLAQLKAPRAVSDKIKFVLAELDILPVESPIEDELAFVSTQFAGHSGVHEIVCAVREQQEFVSNAVVARNFELAAIHRNQRERLLDSLHDLCAPLT
jgi:hypothetical protein